jgi:hypothetical protein
MNDKTNRFVQPKAAKGSKAIDMDANSDDEENPGRPSVFAMPGDEWEDEDDDVEQDMEVPDTADSVNNPATNDDDDDEIL